MPADDQTALWKSKEDVYRLISTKMTPLPGLLDFLDLCRSRGLAMILVTNAPRVDAVHTLEVLDLSDRYGGWGTGIYEGMYLATLSDKEPCGARQNSRQTVLSTAVRAAWQESFEGSQA